MESQAEPTSLSPTSLSFPQPSWKPRGSCLVRSPQDTQDSPLPSRDLRSVCYKVRRLILSLGGFLTKVSIPLWDWAGGEGGGSLLHPSEGSLPLERENGRATSFPLPSRPLPFFLIFFIDFPHKASFFNGCAARQMFESHF